MTGLIIDNFAGAGGASAGIERGTGRRIDYAINHDAIAVGVHRANHPDTIHLTQDIWSVDPAELCAGRAIDFAWFSPDCRHFSKAKGGKPVSKQVRDLANVVHRWAELPAWQRPKVIALENVEEFRDWGPLCPDTEKPLPERKGEDFFRWVGVLKSLGYQVQIRELRACDYGAPTIRNRLFIIARCDGKPIIWPAPTHGKPGSLEVASGMLKPYRTAAEIIDWSLPCPSIFLTKEEAQKYFEATGQRIKRPLADATMRRVARGVQRFVLDEAEPFIVPLSFSGPSQSGDGRESAEDGRGPVAMDSGAFAADAQRLRREKKLAVPFVAPLTHHGERRYYPVDKPLNTVTGAHRGEMAVVTPFITYGQHGGRNRPFDSPFHTITASRKDTNMLVTPFLAGVGGRMGQSGPRPVTKPYHTTTAKADSVLVAPTLIQTGYGEREGQAPRAPGLGKPLGTAVAGGVKHALVAATLTKFQQNSLGQMPDEPLDTVMAGAPRFGLVAAFMAQHNTGVTGHRAGAPVSTLTQRGTQQQVVAAHLINQKGSDQRMSGADGPCPTITANGNHVGCVAAFMTKYYGQGIGAGLNEPVHTCTVKERFSLVTVEIAGKTYAIADIGMRMLVPRELAGAQGFAPGYILERQWDGTPVTKTHQVRLIGNSVCPDLAEALARANCPGVPSSRKREVAA